jgi:hypothetical protein
MTKPDETKTDDKDTKPKGGPPERGERSPPRQRPTLGRVVIYCTREADELVQNVALIVKVHDAERPGAAGVDLFVIYQNGETGREKRVHESEGLEQGRWRWPARAE